MLSPDHSLVARVLNAHRPAINKAFPWPCRTKRHVQRSAHFVLTLDSLPMVFKAKASWLRAKQNHFRFSFCVRYISLCGTSGACRLPSPTSNFQVSAHSLWLILPATPPPPALRHASLELSGPRLKSKNSRRSIGTTNGSTAPPRTLGKRSNFNLRRNSFRNIRSQ